MNETFFEEEKAFYFSSLILQVDDTKTAHLFRNKLSLISLYNRSVNPCTPQAEADSCTPCPVGHFAGVTGLTRCEACPVGEFANVTGSDDCTLCPAGNDSIKDTVNYQYLRNTI